MRFTTWFCQCSDIYIWTIAIGNSTLNHHWGLSCMYCYVLGFQVLMRPCNTAEWGNLSSLGRRGTLPDRSWGNALALRSPDTCTPSVEERLLVPGPGRLLARAFRWSLSTVGLQRPESPSEVRELSYCLLFPLDPTRVGPFHHCTAFRCSCRTRWGLWGRMSARNDGAEPAPLFSPTGKGLHSTVSTPRIISPLSFKPSNTTARPNAPSPCCGAQRHWREAKTPFPKSALMSRVRWLYGKVPTKCLEASFP